MACKFSSPLTLIFLVFTATISLSNAGALVTYWGQHSDEGSLEEICDYIGYYRIVNIAFLSTFGEGRTPVINLSGHCDPTNNGCAFLSSQIKACQSDGIKVLLSIGGGTDTYGLNSTDDAREVAEYIWNNFLGGESDSRPFGDAYLNGIDFDIERGEPENWVVLAETLKWYSETYFLSAAPQCPFPDAHLGAAIKADLFDYVWVKFYNNPPCQYSGNTTNLYSSWDKWTSSIPAKKIFLGLPASPAAANGGYIRVDVLVREVLYYVQSSPKYEGVMLWSKYYDVDYSITFAPHVLALDQA